MTPRSISGEPTPRLNRHADRVARSRAKRRLSIYANAFSTYVLPTLPSWCAVPCHYAFKLIPFAGGRRSPTGGHERRQFHSGP